MNFHIRYFFLVGLIVFLLLISLKIDYSFKEQRFIIAAYNNNEFRSKIWNDKINYRTNFPNLSVTTLPLESIKAYYIRENFGNDKAIGFMKKILKKKRPNPYLGLEEGFLANAYIKLEKFDSAYLYSKIAFEKLPQNKMFSGNHLFVTAMLKKNKEMKNVFDRVKNLNNVTDWKIYLTHLKEEPELISSDSMKYFFKEAAKIFPDEPFFDLNEKIAEYDLSLIDDANSYAEKGGQFIVNKNYKKAIEMFKSASDLVPNEYAYKENIILCNLMLKDFKQVIELSDKLYKSNINIKNNGKLSFYRALSFFELGDKDSGCLNLLESIKKNYKVAKQSYLRKNCKI